MSFPLNSSSSPTVIAAMPFTVSDTFGGVASGVTWFRYTAQANDLMLGLHIATSGGGDAPTVDIFQTIALSATVPGFADKTHPIQTPVTEGVAYYFKLTGDSGSATLTLTIHAQPNHTLDAGFILVPDPSHADTFPPTVLSFGDQAVIRVLPMVGADQMDILPGGVMCMAKIDTAGSAHVNTLALYQSVPFSPYVQLLMTLANPIAPNLVFVKQDHGNNFYIAKNTFGGGTLKVYQVSKAGVVGSTNWTLPGSTLAAFAVSVDGLKVYTSDFSTDTPIGAYDLVNSTPLSNFAAGVSGFKVNSLTVLADNSVVATYIKVSDNTLRIIRYDAAGVSQATLNVTSTQKFVGNISPGDDDPDTVVMRTENAALTNSTFWHLHASDLSTITSFTVDNFDDGEGHNNTAQFFGPSEASSFVTWRTAAAPTPVIGQTTTLPMRRVRQSPHLWDGKQNYRMFFKKFELLGEMGGPRDDDAEPLKFALEVSKDGGNTWGPRVWQDASFIGQYKFRVIWWMRFQARDCVVRVSDSNAARVIINDLLVEAEQGIN